MIPERIHLHALIALRALADYDLHEFRRSTDLSKREIDERMAGLIAQVRSDEDWRGVEEVERRIEELHSVESGAESPVAMAYLMKQLSNSELERAYQLALIHSRTGELRRATGPREVHGRMPEAWTAADEREDEFLRLGVMRLLRDLPSYRPRFNYLVRNVEIDCFLEPMVEGHPPVLIEGKREIQSLAAMDAVLSGLRRSAAGWGRNVVAAVLALSASRDVRTAWKRKESRSLLLVFDPEANEFEADDREELLGAIRGRSSIRP